MTVYRSMGARPEPAPGRGTASVEVRKALASLFQGTGLLPGTQGPVVRGTDSFAYIVGPGAWVTSRGTGDGVHLWGNDGDEEISVADDGTSLAAPAPGLRRFDVIYALHPSDSENGDTSSEPILAVRKGTEASIPTPPSLPVGALALARNEMTSAASSTSSSSGNTITQLAGFASIISPGPGPSSPIVASSGFSSSAIARTMGMFDVQLEGSITGPLAHGANIGSIPSALAPAVEGYFPASCTGQSSALAQSLRVRVTTGGSVLVYGPPTGADTVYLSSIRYRRPHTP